MIRHAGCIGFRVRANTVAASVAFVDHTVKVRKVVLWSDRACTIAFASGAWRSQPLKLSKVPAEWADGDLTGWPVLSNANLSLTQLSEPTGLVDGFLICQRVGTGE